MIATRHLYVRGLGLALTGLLAACGGGGGTTGPLIQRDTARVKVAVVDSGFNINDPEIRSQIDAWYVCTQPGVNVSSLTCGGTDIQDGSGDTHGTYVAQVIAGSTVGYTDDASLLLAKATNLLTSEIELATKWAVDQGARVVNYSLFPMHEVDTYLDRAYAYARTHSTAVVISAGNGGADLIGDNLSDYTYSYGTSLFNSAYADISLVVGAAYQTGGGDYTLWDYSNYPGAELAIQSRFLTALAPADVVNGAGLTVTFNGTSATAPQVSAALATLWTRWPHLTAQQSTQILLDTANDQFAGYSAFYFGQGLLDVNAALQPVGSTTLATGSSVSGGAFSVSGSGLTLSGAFGDAVRNVSLEAAMFDSYGRDFGINVGQLLKSAETHSNSRHWISLLGSRTQQYDDAQLQLRTSFGKDGQWQGSLASFQLSEGYRLNWQRSRGQAFERDRSPVPLLSLKGHGSLAGYEWLDQVGLDWSFDANRHMHTSLTRAQSTSTASSQGQTALRHETRINMRAGDGTTLTGGVALTTESSALLGNGGSGALALNRSVSQTALLRLTHDLGHGWTAFGSGEFGTTRVNGDTLLAGMDRVVTSEWAAGLAWKGDDRWLGLAVSQPLRVEQASARFDLPVGRTVDGRVVRRNTQVDLAPSGRQINLEVAWQQQLGGKKARRGVLGLNAIYSLDAGHVQGASDWALLGVYRRQW